MNPQNFTAVLRIEKTGRGGKTITVIDKSPRSGDYLCRLAKMLKTRCGSGGTYKIEENGVVEIHGDKREMIRAIFKKEKISFKG